MSNTTNAAAISFANNTKIIDALRSLNLLDQLYAYSVDQLQQMLRSAGVSASLMQIRNAVATYNL